MSRPYKVGWVARPAATESSKAFGTLEGAESFYYGIELDDGCWKRLSVEQVADDGSRHARRLVHESKEESWQ